MLFAVLFTITRKWKYDKCSSTDEWIIKLWYICTMEYYLAVKNINDEIYRLMSGPRKKYIQ